MDSTVHNYVRVTYYTPVIWVTYCSHVRVTYGVASISRLLKLQVSFAEYSLFYRALLQKWRMILRSLLIVATPCYTPVIRVTYHRIQKIRVPLVTRTCDNSHSYLSLVESYEWQGPLVFFGISVMCQATRISPLVRVTRATRTCHSSNHTGDKSHLYFLEFGIRRATRISPLVRVTRATRTCH